MEEFLRPTRMRWATTVRVPQGDALRSPEGMLRDPRGDAARPPSLYPFLSAMNNLLEQDYLKFIV